MSEHPFPDDPNAEICAQCGARAYAVIGRGGHDLVTGWYGSTVVDMSSMLALDPDLPRGPICDDCLKKAIAEGKVYDPDPLRAGDVHLSSVPTPVVRGMLRLGMAAADRMLGRPSEGGVCIPPVWDVESDDPLFVGLSEGLFGHPRHAGVDLEAVGRLMTLVARARGRAFDEAEREAAIDAFLERLAATGELLGQMDEAFESRNGGDA